MTKAEQDMEAIRASLREQAERSAEIWKAIGEMGNKWGTFTEGLAAPSVRRVLVEEFGANIVHEHIWSSKEGENQEFDSIGVVNGKKNEVILAEIKSRLTEGELKKFEKKFADFFHFFPDFRGKTLKGMLVAVTMPKSMPERVASRGFYLMRSHGKTFDLLPAAEGFHPRTLKG